jgi:hypothetical protein
MSLMYVCLDGNAHPTLAYWILLFDFHSRFSPGRLLYMELPVEAEEGQARHPTGLYTLDD